MDTAQIKAYAPQARKDFINAVTQRAARFGIHGDDNFDPVEFKGDTAIIGSQVFTKKGGELRERLVAKVKQAGFEMFIRSSAYTWFNRFVAIRYMELHDFLNHGFRVLSNPNGSDIPEILEHATEVDLPGLDREKVLELRLAGDKDNELYRMLVIAQCNALHKAMPFLFDRIDNEAELLLPDNLLHTNSPVKRMVSQIDEVLWDDVEIIGWIYQFYISEKKDEVIGKVVKSEDIPAATQLFTPNWIVKYMVQNTLGRMWMATYPESSLKSKMEYYIEPAEQEPDVQAEIDATTPKELNPEELTFLDPACGSGHILVEAYDILKEIYLERGYRTRDIPRLILSKNIYGLDIDDRAAQLACFAVLMRARKDDRRLFSRDDLMLNIMSIVETKGIDKDKLLEAVSKKDGGKSSWDWINQLVDLFENAKTFGSLITIPEELANKLDEINTVIAQDQIGNDDIFNYIAGAELQNLIPIIREMKILAKKYNCVVANPPYLSLKSMNKKVKGFAQSNYPLYKSDLYSMFFYRLTLLLKLNSQLGIVTPFVWLFIKSYQDLRKHIINNFSINNLVKPSYTAFFESAIVPLVSLTIQRIEIDSFGKYFDLGYLGAGNIQHLKFKEAISDKSSNMLHIVNKNAFTKIPGDPLTYWVSNNTRKVFEVGQPLGKFGSAKKGMDTGNNSLFLRQWYEVGEPKIKFNSLNYKNINSSDKKWVPYNKGGRYRKWYGNIEYVVNWKNSGHEIKNYKHESGKQKSCIRNESFYFKPSISWSDVNSSYFGARKYIDGFIFDSAGPSVFPQKGFFNLLLGFFCSNVASHLMKVLNPTLHFLVGNVSSLPILFENIDDRSKNRIIRNVDEMVTIAKTDWDSYEISWSFSKFRLMEFVSTNLEESHLNWRQKSFSEITRLQELEYENNIIFSELYELSEELDPTIPLSEITLNCNSEYNYGKSKTEKEREELLKTDTIKDLFSYFIGCAMGRYSIDNTGLIYAHSGNINFDSSKYKSFPSDDDGIIPIMDMNWFEDDATKRFVEFIKTAWPKEYLDENLKFVADSLNPKANESPEDTIRRYLSTTFFKDHIKMYKKRPIYWLFSSGKQKAFECLVYLHRYNESTLSRMRSNYVTPLQGNISAKIEFLDHEKDAATTPSAQKKIQKQIDVLKKKQVELKNFDDELRHYADMKISLDLDDGVKVNYDKFGNLLAEKKAITGKA